MNDVVLKKGLMIQSIEEFGSIESQNMHMSKNISKNLNI